MGLGPKYLKKYRFKKLRKKDIAYGFCLKLRKKRYIYKAVVLHPWFVFTTLIARGNGFLVNGEVKIVAEVDVLEVIGKLDVMRGYYGKCGYQWLSSTCVPGLAKKHF